MLRSKTRSTKDCFHKNVLPGSGNSLTPVFSYKTISQSLCQDSSYIQIHQTNQVQRHAGGTVKAQISLHEYWIQAWWIVLYSEINLIDGSLLISARSRLSSVTAERKNGQEIDHSHLKLTSTPTRWISCTTLHDLCKWFHRAYFQLMQLNVIRAHQHISWYSI